MSTNEARWVKLSEGGREKQRGEGGKRAVLGPEEAADALSNGFDGRSTTEGKEDFGKVEQVGGALNEDSKEKEAPEAEIATVGLVPGGGVASRL